MVYFDTNERIVTAIYDAVIAAYKTTDVDLPRRRFLGYAGMTIDCEMLSVVYARQYQVAQTQGPDAEGVQAHRCLYWAGSDIDILVVRCTPQPRTAGSDLLPPTTEALNAFSKIMMADPIIIAKGVRDAWKAGDLGEGANIAFADTANIGDESGMFIGIRARVRVGHLL